MFKNIVGESFIVNVDREKISTVGIPALKHFLMKLNVYKCLGDYENGSTMFSTYSVVDDKSLAIRNLYLNERKPRHEFVQPTLRLVDEKVKYVQYEPTVECMIQSFVDKNVF